MDKWCLYRAIEWGRIPVFASQPIMPILLIFLPALSILSFLIILTGIWAFILCYHYINLGVANYASCSATIQVAYRHRMLGLSDKQG